MRVLLLSLLETLAALLAATFLIGAATAEEIQVRADEWYPYNGNPGDEKPGFMIEIAEEIFRQAGHSINYKIAPWARAIKDAQDGKIDAIIGAAINEAPGLIFPAVEFGQSETAFFANQGESWKYLGPESLSKILFSAVVDYEYTGVIDRYIAENKNNSSRINLASGNYPIARIPVSHRSLWNFG